MNKKPLALLITSILLSPLAVANDDHTSIERMSVIGSKEDLIKSTGSVTLIDELELEKFEYDGSLTIRINEIKFKVSFQNTLNY